MSRANESFNERREHLKQLFLIRGLPGSGKTRLAKTLLGEDGQSQHFEADQFFMVNGVYQFDKNRIGEAHDNCRARVVNAMVAGMSPIVVSNTFSQRWEMKVYQVAAEVYDYQVTELMLTGKLFPNVHDVPDEVIQRMIERWQFWSKSVTDQFTREPEPAE